MSQPCSACMGHVSPGKSCHKCGAKGALPEPTYLGDGAYASYDAVAGILVLITGHHDPRDADATVYLEHTEYAKLLAFGRQIWPKAG